MSVLPLQVLHMRINKLNTNNIPAWVGKIVECLSEFPQNYICKTNINVILYFKNNFHSDTNETIWGGKRVIYTDNFEIMHFECFISFTWCLFLCIQRETNRTCTSKNLLNSVPDCNEGKAKEDSKCATNLSKKGWGWKNEHLTKYNLIFEGTISKWGPS